MKSKSGVPDLLAAQAVAAGSSLLVVVATAHFMGVEGRGELAFVLGVSNLVGALAFGSLHVGATMASTSGAADGKLVALRLAIVSAILVTLGGLALAVVLVVNRAPLAMATLLAGVGAGLVTINLATLRIGQAAGDDRGFRNAWAVQGIGFLVAGSAAAAVTASPAVVVLAWFISLVVSTVMMAKRLVWLDAMGSPASYRAVLTTSWRAHSGTVGTQILTRMPLVALGISSTASEVGLYSVAAPIAEATWLVSEAFSLLSFRTEAMKQSSAVDHRKSARLHTFMTCVGGILVGVGAYILLPILLPDFAESRVLVLCLIPGVLVQGAARVAMARLVGRGASRAVATIGVASVAASATFFAVAWCSGALGVAILASTLYAVQGLVILAAERATRSMN